MAKRRFRRVPAHTLCDGDIFWSAKSRRQFRRIKAHHDFICIWAEGRGEMNISRDDWFPLKVWIEVKNGKN